MLSTKKLLYKMLDTFGTPKTTWVSPSDFITLSSGWTITDAEVVKLGRLTMWRTIFTNTVSMPNNTQLTVGTLKSPYRASIISGLTSIAFLGLATPSGEIYLRNVSGSTLNAGTQTTVCGFYIGENMGGVACKSVIARLSAFIASISERRWAAC